MAGKLLLRSQVGQAQKAQGALRGIYLPGIQNQVTDFLSHQKKTLPREWRLLLEVGRTSGVSAGQRWISLPQRHQPIVRSGSPMTENTSPLGQDALALKWPEFFLYAFPLFIFPTLLRVLHWGRRVFLVIPFWPARTLFSLLHRLRFRTPWPKVTGDCLYKCPVCMSVRWKISTNKYCLWQLSRVLEPWLHL